MAAFYDWLIQPLPTPSSIAWCTTRTASSSKVRACARSPPSVRSLTPSLSNELMRTPTREQGPGGRDHRTPRPASIGMGGRLRSESPADFVGMRMLAPDAVDFLHRRVLSAEEGFADACSFGKVRHSVYSDNIG